MFDDDGKLIVGNCFCFKSIYYLKEKNKEF